MKLTRVLHVGVVGDLPGGMAQVVNEYLTWHFRATTHQAVASTHGRHDLLAPARWLRAALRLVAFRLSGRRRVLAVHLSQGGSFIREGSLVALARAIRLPVAIHVHGSSFVGFSERHPKLVRTVLSKARIVLPLSDATQQAIAHLCLSVPVTRIRNGVALPAYQAATRNKRILMAGEIGYRKGADVLLQAWEPLSEAYPDWELVLAGPLTMATLQPRIEELPRVTWLGPIHHDDLMNLMRTSYIAVLPSRNEALPMFLLEAMSHGCAAVGTNVGQVADLISPSTGRLIEPDDVLALKEALNQLMHDVPETIRHGERARTIIEATYSSSAIGEELDRLWLSVL